MLPATCPSVTWAGVEVERKKRWSRVPDPWNGGAAGLTPGLREIQSICAFMNTALKAQPDILRPGPR